MKPYRFIIGVVAAAIFFVLFPGADLGFSRLFYQPSEGFFPRGNLAVDILYDMVIVIAYTTLFSPFWIKIFYRHYGHRPELQTGPP